MEYAVKRNEPVGMCSEPKRLNVIIERNVYMDIKEYCMKNDTSISAVTRELWLEYLGKMAN